MPTEAEAELLRGLRPRRKAGRPKSTTLTLAISLADRCLLDTEAKTRGTTTKTLAGKVLKVVTRDRLFDAVLDGD
jgi:hypothetical protein